MRKQFVEGSRYQAKKQCPWASTFRRAVGGYWAFEDIRDAELWDRTK